MKNILAAIDGSSYLDSICKTSLFVANKTGSGISLLHVSLSHEEFESNSDLSGSIGLDAQDDLLEELSKIDEKRGKIEQEKGRIILQQASSLIEKETKNYKTIHRRGSLVENLEDLQNDFDLLIVGKKGYHRETSSQNLGLNIEKISRSINKPIIVTSKDSFKNSNAPQKFLLCYDGSESANKMLDFICDSDLLKGLECHLIKVCEQSGKAQEILNKGQEKLEKHGFKVISSIQEDHNLEVSQIVRNYIKNNSIDLLTMGAFGHSSIRNFFLGSTTDSIIKTVTIPVLMVH